LQIHPPNYVREVAVLMRTRGETRIEFSSSLPSFPIFNEILSFTSGLAEIKLFALKKRNARFAMYN
ncbi:MAG: hypothetical protein PHW28_05810, partial [Mesotoga sp.]|nr:hypothetical protein [Mesotoga sp.]